MITWGDPDPIVEGSDFRLEAVLTLNGAKDSDLVTSSGTYTLYAGSSLITGAKSQILAEASDSVSIIGSGTLVAWEITDAQSSGWEAGTYPGHIKLADSAGIIRQWPVTIKVATGSQLNSI